MERALIISNSAKTAALISALLRNMHINGISTAPSASAARRMCIKDAYDLYIIDEPLNGENGTSLSLMLSQKNEAQTIVLAPAEFFEDIAAEVENEGVITISKPFETTSFIMALKLARAVFAKLRTAQKENKLLLEKIEEIRLVDRAKCLLIADYAMTEEIAHKFIEKQSMDLRKTRKEIAEEIILQKKTNREI